MKLLVCVSKILDIIIKIVFNGDSMELNIDGVQYIMNLYDEWYVLVCVLEFKEVVGGIVMIINVGLVVNDVVICKGLVIGVDEVVCIDKEGFSSLDVV